MQYSKTLLTQILTDRGQGWTHPEKGQVAGQEALSGSALAAAASTAATAAGAAARRVAAVLHAQVHDRPLVELTCAHSAAVVKDGDEPRARRACASRAPGQGQVQ